MYTSHFGLNAPPFAITPDPRYLYMSERHREGLAHLLYGIRQPGGFVQLTGEVGTGKTTLCRCLIEQLPPDVNAAVVLNPRLTALELLTTVCDELRIPVAADASTKRLVDALYRHLLEAHASGRRTVLIIDEAQNLSPDVLEQIRLLTNLETATEKLLQIILIGQPELARVLEGTQLRQLAQRITARYHLQPFSRGETRRYIRHRLHVAGGDDALFTRTALSEVHRRSRGIPRLINVICDRALLGAYASDRHQVDAWTVRRAAREIQGGAAYRRRRLAWALGSAGLVALLAAGTLVVGRDRLPFPWTSRALATATAQLPRPIAGDGPASPGASDAAMRRTEAMPGPGLAEILSGSDVTLERRAAVASVYGRWGMQYTGSGAGCEAGEKDDLHCVPMAGSWNKLRRLDLPVVLELAPPTGARRAAALVALRGESATLEIGGHEHRLPVAEIERLWDGSFLLLWKPPLAGARLMAAGARGQDVAWLRKRLGEIEGKEVQSAQPDLFDQELRRHVLAFQRSRSLVADGIVGGETLLHLALAIREPGMPSLSHPSP
ncbi:MAG TPA: AAA family ATPase [Candidatus Sulfotelmatobacter sp.]|nr:AAA family ATPase [Candidatus Sulfotelmatobacter sp.]